MHSYKHKHVHTQAHTCTNFKKALLLPETASTDLFIWAEHKLHSPAQAALAEEMEDIKTLNAMCTASRLLVSPPAC